MKRSKVFLAFTGAALALVGIASAKAHRTAKSTGFFTSSNLKCTKVSVTQGYTVTDETGGVLYSKPGSVKYTVWSKENTSGLCHLLSTNHKLYTQTTE